MAGINRDALFCDETEEYRNPCEVDPGERIQIFFRTEKNGADAVYYIEKIGGDAKKIRMCLEKSDRMFDYYKLETIAGEEPIRYFFQIEKEEEVCFYNRLGPSDQAQEEYDFCIVLGFHVPDWVKGAVIYQIYVDRFCNGETSNDVEPGEYVYLGEQAEKVEDWNKTPSSMDVHRFYGGDLQGVWKKLDYLKSLGVDAIYLNPIFVSPSNHKYDCQDYDYIDPHLAVIKNDSAPLEEVNFSKGMGEKYVIRTADKENLEASNEFFSRFVKAAHEKGIRVILDGVFNHCGSFHKWMDAELIYQREGSYPVGAYVSKDSPYRNFFKFNNEDGWPNNDSYDGWWGHKTLPKLNYEESQELYEYIMKIAEKWVSPPYSVDGWRLDVAADLGRSSEFNHQFWNDFRKAVKKANPDAVILAEHYGNPESWLQGEQWDTVMNYDAFMEPVSWFLTGLEKHSDEERKDLYGNGPAFFEAMKYHMCKMHTPSLMAAMNELSNHDHSRFMTRTNRRVGRLLENGSRAAEEGISYGIFRQGVIIQMTWPGAPTIYYGDETGVCGWTDPDNRRTYPWGKENYELIEFHRYMTKIRHEYPAFRTGSVKALLAEQDVIAYGRFYKKNRGIVLINTGEKKTVFVPVWQIGIEDTEEMVRKMMTYEEGYNAGTVRYPVKAGMLEIEVPLRGALVFVSEAE